jgi:hypothetical protein
MSTGKKAGSAASKVITGSEFQQDHKTTAASDLAQRPRNTGGKKK